MHRIYSMHDAGLATMSRNDRQEEFNMKRRLILTSLVGWMFPIVWSATVEAEYTNTLPLLKLQGIATSLRLPSTSRDATLHITEVGDTQADPSLVRCSQTSEGMGSFTASGALVIGFRKYDLYGICYNSAKRELEILAHNADEIAVLTGVLATNPSHPSKLSGRFQSQRHQQCEHFRIELYSNQETDELIAK